MPFPCTLMHSDADESSVAHVQAERCEPSPVARAKTEPCTN